MGLLGLAEKMIVPSAPHEPPRPAAAFVSISTEPLIVSIRLSLPCAKKATDRLLQFSSISFDIAIEEMYPTWVVGATLVFRSGGFSLAGSDFLHQQEVKLLKRIRHSWQKPAFLPSF